MSEWLIVQMLASKSSGVSSKFVDYRMGYFLFSIEKVRISRAFEFRSKFMRTQLITFF